MRYNRNIVRDEREECIWCNKKNAMKFEVLIIHSSHDPSKHAYVQSPRARGSSGRIFEIAMRCTFSRYKHGTRRMQHSGAAGSDALHTARQKMYQMRDERRTNG